MRVAIAGGNGFIGRRLTQQLLADGHEIVWLSHTVGRHQLPAGVREIAFDPADETAPWSRDVAEADAVVNLSGYPIASRWSDRAKELLVTSRIETTRALGNTIRDAALAGAGPAVYVGACGIGIYGDAGDEVLDEQSRPGTDWLAQLAVDWEREALAIGECGCRVVTVRTGLVLGEEGLVPKMALPTKLFVGGPVGNGRQWVSWISHEDIAGVYRFAIEHEALEGPVNACAPEPVRMKDFSKALGDALHRPSWFPVPGLMLKIVLGEVAPYMLFSQRAVPAKLEAAGHTWQYPELDEALRASL